MKSIKWIGIISVILIVVGAVIGAACMAGLGWDFSRLDNLTYTEHTVTAEALDITDISEITAFNYDSVDWKVEITKGDYFSIKYYTTEKTKSHSVDYTDGVISFDYEEDWFVGMMFFAGLNKYRFKVEIVLPDNIDMSFKAVNINLDMSDRAFGKLSVKGTNTDVNLKNCTAEDIIFDSTNGNINMEDVTCAKADIKGTNIDFSADDCTFASVSFHSTNGDADMKDVLVTDTYELRGTNMTAKIKTKSKLADFAGIAISGTNRTLRINGDKRDGYNGSGGITLTASGTNITVNLTTSDK